MKTIAWDVDDVLNDLMRAWFTKEWKKKHPAKKVTYANLTKNPPENILGITCESYLRSLDNFRRSPKYKYLRPIPEVLTWFRKYGHEFRHIALTAVPLFAAPILAEWVFKHFGNWIRTFHFVPSKREGKTLIYDGHKGDFLQWIRKVDVLIDDNLVNIQLAENAGVKGIVMPRPWNDSKRTLAETLKKLGKI